MERREEWYQGNPDSYISSHRLYFKGRLVATTATPDDATQLVVTLNQHAALVEQRDRLLRLLRPVTSPTACYCAVMKDEKCWHCEARELIATVEQGEGREERK